ADAELASLGRDYVADRHFKLPPDALHFHLMSLQRAAADDRPLGLAQPLIVLWAAVGAILLIGCVNIAGLMLVRGATRQHELATRLALGGGRRSIVGQLLAESSIIAFAGGAGGLAIGYGALAGLRRIVVQSLELQLSMSIDLRVIALCAAAAILSTLL